MGVGVLTMTLTDGCMMLIGECCCWLWLKKILQNHLICLKHPCTVLLFIEYKPKNTYLMQQKIVQFHSKKKQIRGRVSQIAVTNILSFICIFEKGQRYFLAFYKKRLFFFFPPNMFVMA